MNNPVKDSIALYLFRRVFRIFDDFSSCLFCLLRSSVLLTHFATTNYTYMTHVYVAFRAFEGILSLFRGLKNTFSRMKKTRVTVASIDVGYMTYAAKQNVTLRKRYIFNGFLDDILAYQNLLHQPTPLSRQRWLSIFTVFKLAGLFRPQNYF